MTHAPESFRAVVNACDGCRTSFEPSLYENQADRVLDLLDEVCTRRTQVADLERRFANLHERCIESAKRERELQARFDRLRADFDRLVAWHTKAIQTIRRMNRDAERWSAIATAESKAFAAERERLRTWARMWKERARWYRRAFDYTIELAADRVFERAHERASSRDAR